MANDDKKNVWAKIIKLFLEFLIAALVAWFGSGCVRNIKPRCPDISKNLTSLVAHLSVTNQK